MPPSDIDRILAEVDRAADEIVDFAARLVRIPTVNPPGEEYETCANAIGDQLRAHGAEVQLLPAIGKIEHTPRHPRINVVGRHEGRAQGPAIHLNGHFDVVPAGLGWTRDPFGGEIVGRMSDEHNDIIAAQHHLATADEYEEISSEEVDRAVEALDRLIAGVQSENIKHYLEEAASNIYYLVYEQEVAETDEEIDQAA